MSEAVGEIMLVAIAVGILGGSAIAILSWCWSFDCQVEAVGKGPLEGHPFAHYANDTERGWVRVCWPLLVDYNQGKAVSYQSGEEACQIVATMKDPNDHWHN